jgi:hypothetical protein
MTSLLMFGSGCHIFILLNVDLISLSSVVEKPTFSDQDLLQALETEVHSTCLPFLFLVVVEV